MEHLFWPVACRSILGAVACGFLGLLGIHPVADLIRYRPAEDGYGLVWAVVTICGVIGAIVGGLAGHWKIRGDPWNIIGSILVGLVLGLIGGFVFGAVASYDGKTFMPPKEGPACVIQGLHFGIPIGTVGGALAGLALGVGRRGSGEEGDLCDDL